MTNDYVDLKILRESRGYLKLLALWAQQGSKMMDSAQRAAARSQESAWRYYAGQIKGFDIAITQVERALLQMESDNQEETPASQTVQELLKDLKENKT